MGDLFERSPCPQLGSSITRDKPIQGVSVRQTHAGFPSVFLPRSKTPSCQQCTPICTHTYIHTIHTCIYASWWDVLVYGGGNRRQRERKIQIGSGDDWLMTTYIRTLYYPPRFHPHCCLRSQSSDCHSRGAQAPTLIAQDNNACIFLVKGTGMYARAKHIASIESGNLLQETSLRWSFIRSPVNISRQTSSSRVCLEWHSSAIVALSWASELKYIKLEIMLSYTVHCNTITLMLHIRISYVNVVLNPPHCEAAGMMESGWSFLYASCGGGFMQPIMVWSL